jgi:hypothetical protein
MCNSYRLWNESTDSPFYGILEGNTNSCPHWLWFPPCKIEHAQQKLSSSLCKKKKKRLNFIAGKVETVVISKRVMKEHGGSR